ncbi:MAG: hypothetical protein U5L96_07970 [Owenweeksia sp.]|nr:hypothetical protein [Owenweeksia sp.]
MIRYRCRNRGMAAGSTLVLTSTPQNAITNIRGSFTRRWPGNGNQRTYSLHYTGTNFSSIDSDDSVTLSILYTIIDN